ncbi:fluoride efflux transporter CrcB [Psychrobium sp. 1_MG-2023]|uniref:fluoride efflux transporter CrcB n=1 Tax=Psychrobium sp. 1_MG-2023 TaxID=3062624 RepID=UPI000C32E792|nr:fluoride efflux transporter CrcB [Psychrobium sp. 1_MG-2023]MDP2561864.1 fluoride efflux transporter CrcB [Psychrobium sp. 1_MG-2023]PKF59720.1 fluoride efflux transporter CrcB [Alteromonadales bacterium alter-6D02]
MNNLLLIAIGGAFGAVSRYGLAYLAINLFGKGFPFGTLIANFVGSFLMGLLFGLVESGQLLPQARIALGVGFLGALTTFSTFSLDTLLLLQQGEWMKALLNVLLNVILSLAAAFLGLWLITK